jgi:hypothetical protein
MYARNEYSNADLENREPRTVNLAALAAGNLA